MQFTTLGRRLPLAAALILAAAPASALSVNFSDGSDDYTITDNGPGDTDLRPDAASIDYDSGASSPLAGWGPISVQASSCLSSLDCPNLSLSFEANSQGEAGELIISITETDLTLEGDPFAFDTTLSGFTEGAVTFEHFYDPTNVAFGQAVQIGDTFDYTTPESFTSYADDDGGVAMGANPFSLTTVIRIAHEAGATQSYGDSKTAVSASPVPVPAALPMLGGALAISGVALRRRRKA